MNQQQRDAIVGVCDLALKAGGMQIKGKVDIVLSLLVEDIKGQQTQEANPEIKKVKK